MSAWRMICVVSVLGLVGCSPEIDEGPDEEEGLATLANAEDADKSDTVFGKQLRYVVRGEWAWGSESRTSMSTDASVLTQTSTLVRVRALRVSVEIPDDVLQLSVTPRSYNDLGGISTKMAFLLFARVGRHGTWSLVSCAGRDTYFESVLIDPYNREIDVVSRTSAGDRRRSYSWSTCGIPAGATHVGLFPFPSSNWGNMEGYYHLDVEADCGSSYCRG